MKNKYVIRRSLNFAVIQHNIFNMKMTLQEVASKNGMSLQEFTDEAIRCIGKDKLRKLEEASKRNEESKEGKESVESHTVVNDGSAQDNQEEVGMACDKNGTPKVADKASVAELERMLQNATSHKEAMEALVISDTALMSQIEQSEESAADEIAKAEEALAKAKKALEEVKMQKADLSEKMENHKAAHKDAEELEKSYVEAINRIKNQIYIIAHNYNGEIPEYGVFYAAETNKRVNAQVMRGVMLNVDPPDDFVLTAGFASIEDFKKAVEFAKLCVRVQNDQKEFAILVNDKKIKKLLEFQGFKV